MRRHLARVLALAATVAFLAIGSGASAVSAGDPCFHGFEMPATTTAESVDIKLMPCAFGPTVTEVATGGTVTFYNGPDFVHLITGANQAWGSRDVEVRPNQKISYTFDKPGIYPYACALHRGMSGAIVVGDPKATAVGGTTNGTGTTTSTGATAGDTTGATAGDAAGATTISPTAASTSGFDADAILLAVLAAAAGILVGGVTALMAVRTRRTGKEQVTA